MAFYWWLIIGLVGGVYLGGALLIRVCIWYGMLFGQKIIDITSEATNIDPGINISKLQKKSAIAKACFAWPTEIFEIKGIIEGVLQTTSSQLKDIRKDVELKPSDEETTTE